MEENVKSEKENEGNEGLGRKIRARENNIQSRQENDNRKGNFWEEDSNWKPNDKKFHVSFF